MTSLELYPTSPKHTLAQFIGRSIRDVPTPAAVVNVAAVRRNCERMLQTCLELGLGWRAHVKTHKTVEITEFQVGHDVTKPVNLIVSTLAEAEFLLPRLEKYRSQGRKVNVLYGLPISQDALPRLAAVARALGEGSVSVLVDDPAQIPIVSQFRRQSGVMPHAHIKVDMGGKRAGVEVQSLRFLQLADAALEAHSQAQIRLSGLYSHAGHSYGGDSRAAAIKTMRAEIGAMLEGADRLTSRAADKAAADLPPLVVSAGASPTALAVQNLISTAEEGRDSSVPGQLEAEVEALAGLFATARRKGRLVEIHAGVYPVLDLQQLAAHSISGSRLSWADMALTVLAQVHSNYPGRGANGTPEALIGAGGIALAREACKAYEGMAMLTPWGRKDVGPPTCDVEHFHGWIVGRFSQEHGILTWRSGSASESGPVQPDQELPGVGEKVRLWPNHACITSSHFGWYFVVDEDEAGKEDEIVDVWVRCRGW
ncbi:Alanine racemase [Metarhizium album ARSEF 1941]|uniref:D-serine dehydratase n=1 Tax=Metarhizium album (strain ARSEF 1941) TaxID=1081103 RepID=A0A0B2X8K7_METAS|nr:Alanine racemase [Metarhizium album ARSEF 1941]KHO01636.1 Alanine racemase [Metarhizium album ARSEF 1941]